MKGKVIMVKMKVYEEKSERDDIEKDVYSNMFE